MPGIPMGEATFQGAVLLYLLGFLAMVLRARRLGRIVVRLGLCLNLLSAGIRYYASWPLLPLFQGPYFLPLFFGVFCLPYLSKEDRTIKFFSAALGLIGLPALFFPNDFYVPFLQSKTVFSHVYFVFGAVGRACFFVSALLAVLFLMGSGKKDKAKTRPVYNWIVWGFVFWTLSMFSAEAWSYLSTGHPVVWEDASMTTTIATWFYYACFLHLHLYGLWSHKFRSMFAAVGALFVFAFTTYPELGAFRVPGFKWAPF